MPNKYNSFTHPHRISPRRQKGVGVRRRRDDGQRLPALSSIHALPLPPSPTPSTGRSRLVDLRVATTFGCKPQASRDPSSRLRCATFNLTFNSLRRWRGACSPQLPTAAPLRACIGVVSSRAPLCAVFCTVRGGMCVLLVCSHRRALARAASSSHPAEPRVRCAHARHTRMRV